MERAVGAVMQLSKEQLKRRRQRSLAIALILAAMVALFYAVTMVRIGANIAERAL